MTTHFVGSCPKCGGEMEKGAIKFPGYIAWTSTETDGMNKTKEYLKGNRYFLLHRGVAGAERCADCDLVIF